MPQTGYLLGRTEVPLMDALIIVIALLAVFVIAALASAAEGRDAFVRSGQDNPFGH